MAVSFNQESISVFRPIDNPVLSRYHQKGLQENKLSSLPGYTEEIDLYHYLYPRPEATFIIRFKGDSMTEAHIPDNALLVIDTSIKPENKLIVLAQVNDRFIIRRYIKNSSGIRLMPAHYKYPPIPITDELEYRVCGVVTKIIIDTLI